MADYAEQMKGDLREVVEIRTTNDTGDSIYRAAYTTRIGEVVYFLDIFKNKSKQGIKTPRKDLERIKGRLRIAKEHYEKHYR
jgi:phage-related protein